MRPCYDRRASLEKLDAYLIDWKRAKPVQFEVVCCGLGCAMALILWLIFG